MALATAACHDLLRIIEINGFDTDRLAEHLRAERTRQVLLQHAGTSHALFGFAVGIDNRFFDERLEPRFAKRATSGHVCVDRLRGGLTADRKSTRLNSSHVSSS